jgi:putative transposase
MPRRPRIHLPETPLHLVQRGHNRQPCFFEEADYQAYLHWLGDALRQSGCALHAYVLMTNHVHLLLTPPGPRDVSQLMISLGRRYVQYINKTYRRTGTLWDSRYKASVIQSEHYLLLCQRYIELNPVRAGMVNNPVLHRWSSYHGNALGQQDDLITPHSLYLGIAPTVEERQESYRALFLHPLGDGIISDIRMASHQNQPLGNNRFMEKIEQVTGQRREAKPRGRPRKIGSSADNL